MVLIYKAMYFVLSGLKSFVPHAWGNWECHAMMKCFKWGHVKDNDVQVVKVIKERLFQLVLYEQDNGRVFSINQTQKLMWSEWSQPHLVSQREMSEVNDEICLIDYRYVIYLIICS